MVKSLASSPGRQKNTTPGIMLNRRLSVLRPFVLPADLLLFFGGKIVGDIEGLSNLLWGLALDHVGNGLAANVQQGLDVEIV